MSNELSAREFVFAFGVPTTKETFWATEKLPNTYASQFIGGWQQYSNLWVKEAVQFNKKGLIHGANFEFETTSTTFAKLFLTQDFKCIVLLSHWHDDRIEFSDGFVHFSELVELVPLNFCGILDLCVCHPNALVDALRLERPCCLVRFVPRKARPDLWLIYYDKLLRLTNSGISFDEAMASLTTAILDLPS